MLYTVYGLHEAGKPGVIEYVGCTERSLKQRLAGHIEASRHQFFPVNQWVAKLISEGKQVSCQVLLTTEDVSLAFKFEAEMIAHFAARGGPLHNIDGARRRRKPGQGQALKEAARSAQEARLVKALADTEAALQVVQAKIEDGSLDIQSFLSGQN